MVAEVLKLDEWTVGQWTSLIGDKVDTSSLTSTVMWSKAPSIMTGQDW